MTLALYHHPLSSFSHKVLIAFYENGLPFESRVVDFADDDGRARFHDLWPIGKIPVLRDESRNRTIPETSIIIEYVDRHYPGPCAMLPDDETARLDARLWDRLFDLYVQIPLQKIVADRMRRVGERDPAGVADARSTLATAYDMIERRMTDRTWAVGDSFSIADCAAAPALFYASIVEPFPQNHCNLAAYFVRLLERPSYARTLGEARPYFHMFPYKDDMPARFLDETVDR